MKIKLIFCLFSLFIVSETVGQDRFKVVGYYNLRSAMENKVSIPLKRLTHVNLWFLNPDSMGNFPTDLSKLEPFLKKAHRKKVKVLFSIGGGSSQPQYHKLLMDEHRDMLVKNFVDLVVAHDVDGIDVDLEGRNIDANYEKFVEALGAELHKHNKLLTAATAIYYKDQVTDRALAQFDFINVMSYDRTGPWRPEKPGPHAPYEAAVEDLDYFLDVRKVPKEKVTLGVPFYGYGYGPELTSPAISMSYSDIVEKFPGAEEKDEWKMPDGKILYYNGAPTMKRKVALAKSRASGVMIWQVRGDAKGRKSLLKVIDKARKK